LTHAFATHKNVWLQLGSGFDPYSHFGPPFVDTHAEPDVGGEVGQPFETPPSLPGDPSLPASLPMNTSPPHATTTIEKTTQKAFMPEGDRKRDATLKSAKNGHSRVCQVARPDFRVVV
jgi:hypothetical protein